MYYFSYYGLAYRTMMKPMNGQGQDTRCRERFFLGWIDLPRFNQGLPMDLNLFTSVHHWMRSHIPPPHMNSTKVYNCNLCFHTLDAFWAFYPSNQEYRVFPERMPGSKFSYLAWFRISSSRVPSMYWFLIIDFGLKFVLNTSNIKVSPTDSFLCYFLIILFFHGIKRSYATICLFLLILGPWKGPFLGGSYQRS